jgi:hypothetical protein
VNCPTCRTAMKPLAGLTEFCPNDCDRIPVEVSDDPTIPLGKPVAIHINCPNCRSLNLEAWDVGGDLHCWDCGKVFDR